MNKKILIYLLIIALSAIVFIVAINVYVKKIGSQICENQTKKQAAIVLGARVYSSGRISDIFKDRIDTAIKLHQEGKAEKILISGDHGNDNYDEVNAAKNYLIEKEIKPEDIFLDHAGFDTFDSIYRAKHIFLVESATIVTQNYHLPRALYIAKKLNLEACGQSSDLHQYSGADKRETREIFARIKAWFNIIFNSKPKFLGESIPISGDGRITWD